jgi:sporulation protein YabP
VLGSSFAVIMPQSHNYSTAAYGYGKRTMEEEGEMENKGSPLYQLTLTNREVLSATGVLQVESFDDSQIVAATKLGPLVIKGEGLHITHLNLEEGQLTLEGVVSGIQYVEDRKAKLKTRSKGIMDRLFK